MVWSKSCRPSICCYDSQGFKVIGYFTPVGIPKTCFTRRDLQSWTPSWQPLSPFALELIVEKSLASTGLPLSPGDGLRRVLEAIAGGCVLNGCPGLLDPCEKEPLDALSNLSSQEREALTSHAQRALRLLAFRQIHIVLNMDQLNTFSLGSSKKRPASESSTNGPSAAKIAKEK